MLKLLTLVCFSWLVADTFAGLAPFITKCKWSDRTCLIKSSQKAVPVFASGIPDLGLPPLDPVSVKSVPFNEGGWDMVFKDVIVTGTKDCQVIDVERNIDERWLKFTCECPIDVRGNYVASGQLLALPVEGNGPFHIQTDKLRFSIKHKETTIDGKDGQKHWQFNDLEHSFEFIDKTLINFENLFNGDQEKAAPIMNIFDQNWKELSEVYGKVIVDEVLFQISATVNKFFEAVPISELEI